MRNAPVRGRPRRRRDQGDPPCTVAAHAGRGHAGRDRGTARGGPGPCLRPAPGLPAAGGRARSAPRDGRRGRCRGAGDHVVDLGAALPRLHRTRLRDGGRVRRRDRAAGGVAPGRRLEPDGVPAPDGQPRGTWAVGRRPAGVGAVPPRRRAQGRRAQLPDRLRGRRGLREAPRTRRARARCARGQLRALERARPAHRQQGHRDPTTDARRAARAGARSPRADRGDRSGPAGHQGQARQGLRPRARRSRHEGRRSLVGGGRTGRLLGRGARPGPSVCAPLDAEDAHEALLVLADFVDLKSPWTSGHSRGVAALALEACGPTAEAAALVHDLGCVSVPNSIWDKPGPLTRDERDRVETHALGDRPAPATGLVHLEPGRPGQRRGRAVRRVGLPPPGQRRAPRRRAAGPGGGRLLPGHGLGASAPTRAPTRRCRVAAAVHEPRRAARRRGGRAGAGRGRSPARRRGHPSRPA